MNSVPPLTMWIKTLFRIRCHGSYGGLCYTCYLLIVKQNSLVLFSNRLVRGYRRLGDLRWWRCRLRNVSRFLSGRKPRTRTIHFFSCFLMTGDRAFWYTSLTSTQLPSSWWLLYKFPNTCTLLLPISWQWITLRQPISFELMLLYCCCVTVELPVRHRANGVLR